MRVIEHVYEESDYSIFRKMPENRDVVSTRLNKLMASISEKYILNPVVVNEKMEIIDGQGRYEALKALGKPIVYVIARGATIDDCRRMNKYNTRWDIHDYAVSYSKRVMSYKRLLETCRDTRLAITRVLRLSNHGTNANSKTYDMSLYESGKLVFTEDDDKTVKTVKKAADEILEMLQYTGRPNEAFYTGVKIVVETPGYNHSRMLKNCQTLRSSYVQMARLKDQLVEFERIYNHKARNNSRVYFSDYMRNKGYSVRDYDFAPRKYEVEDVSTLKED